MIDTTEVVSALVGALQSVAVQLRPMGGPRLMAVVPGVPVGATDVDRAAYVWWDGEDSERETLGNIMVTHRFVVALAWVVRPSRALYAELESEIIDTVRAVKTQLRGDSTLGGSVTDLKLTPAIRTTGPLLDPAVSSGTSPVYHIIQFDVLIDDYEAEVIAP
jgi:hypothetical protein